MKEAICSIHAIRRYYYCDMDIAPAAASWDGKVKTPRYWGKVTPLLGK